MEINTNESVVTSLSSAIQGSSRSLELTAVNVVAAIGFSMETDCSNSYQEASSIISSYQSQLSTLTEAMNSTHQTLFQADVQAQKSSN